MDFLQFSSNPISIRCSSTILYTPPLEEITIKKRYNFSLFVILKGELIYRYEQNLVHFYENDVIFLPAKSVSYSYEALSEGTTIKQIFFDFSLEGATIGFDHPTKITGIAENTIKNTIDRIFDIRYSNSIDASIEASSLILKCMQQILFSDKVEEPHSQILPAISRMKENPDIDISIKDLAALCGISESHFRRLFVSEMGMSPLKYKNKLRVNRSCDYLINHMLPVSRVAEIMNFDTVYSFSKFFKNEMGISPLKYVKSKHSM